MSAVPNRVYECKGCGHFERRERMADPRVSCCPTCGGEVRYIFGVPTIFVAGRVRPEGDALLAPLALGPGASGAFAGALNAPARFVRVVPRGEGTAEGASGT